MRVIIAGEFSGKVREAFRSRGHDAWSCDLLPAADNSPYHIQTDANMVLNYPLRVYGPWTRPEGWDLLIAHPPCTYFCNSGVRWFTTIPARPKAGVLYGPARWDGFHKAGHFWQSLLNAPIARKCLENPIPHGYARDQYTGTYTQIIQPWQFGHGEIKRTCLWLQNLPELKPTAIVSGRVPRVHHASPSADRWKERSITYAGIAAAMADQWGNL